MVKINVNRREYRVEVSPDIPLLWALRDSIGLTGTKFGCGFPMGVCGACTVHVDGAAIRSCITLISSVEGKEITTIEGLSPDSSHPVQRAWIAEEVAQCGYCQPGQIMAAAAHLARTPTPSDAEIDAAMVGNLCPCGTYQRIRKAVRHAAQLAGGAR